MKALDALIVGGGPAGTAAAIALASRGREVVVLERSDYTAARIGETLPGAANPLLESLGVLDRMEADGHVRCPGAECSWGDAEPYLSDALYDPDGDGWHLDRARFDAVLAARAALVGATVITQAEIRVARREGPHWLAEVGGVGPVRARMLIDAAGRASWPGRPSRRVAYDRQVAMVCMLEPDSGRLPDRRTWIESVQNGWWYASAVPGGRLVACYFTDADLVRARGESPRTRWDRLLAEAPGTSARLRGARPERAPRLVPASSTLAQRLAGPGWAAAGDAASTIDPLSSQGIAYAIRTGQEAALALLDTEPAEALRRYAADVAARFFDDLTTRRDFCSRERRWPDSPFWQRRSGPVTLRPSTSTEAGAATTLFGSPRGAHGFQ